MRLSPLARSLAETLSITMYSTSYGMLSPSSKTLINKGAKAIEALYFPEKEV